MRDWTVWDKNKSELFGKTVEWNPVEEKSDLCGFQGQTGEGMGYTSLLEMAEWHNFN